MFDFVVHEFSASQRRKKSGETVRATLNTTPLLDGSWPISALSTGVSLTEIGMMVAVFRTWRFPYPDITVNQAAIMTAIFVSGIPGITAISAGLVLHMNFCGPLRVGHPGKARHEWHRIQPVDEANRRATQSFPVIWIGSACGN